MAIVLEGRYLPATLSCAPMSEEFAEFRAEHIDLFFEMTTDHQLIVTQPNYTSNGIRNVRILFRFGSWARRNGRGIVTEATGDFVPANGARRSPDASWVSKDQIRELSPESLQRLWHVCRDFVIELRSSWDRLAVLRDNMREWVDNGTAFGWLIDPESRTVEIFRAHGEPTALQGTAGVEGGRPVTGFRLELDPVWEPPGA